jgi:hypothetical protein
VYSFHLVDYGKTVAVFELENRVRGSHIAHSRQASFRYCWNTQRTPNRRPKSSSSNAQCELAIARICIQQGG